MINIQFCINNATFASVPLDAQNLNSDDNVKDDDKNLNKQVKLQIVKSTEEQLDSPNG